MPTFGGSDYTFLLGMVRMITLVNVWSRPALLTSGRFMYGRGMNRRGGVGSDEQGF
jgi:hypothetical protein